MKYPFPLSASLSKLRQQLHFSSEKVPKSSPCKFISTRMEGSGESEGERPSVLDCAAGDNHVNLDDTSNSDNSEKSVCQLQQPERVVENRGKKQKASYGIESICVVLAEMHRSTNAILDVLVSRIGYDYDLGKARRGIFEKLSDIPGLTLDDKFDVGEMLADNDGRLELFMSLPEDIRKGYVRFLLNKNKK